MQYFLRLDLPLDVTLVFYWAFSSQEAARAYSERLPQGFVPSTEDVIPPDAIVVPFRRQHMKPEELRRYEDAAKGPVSVGDLVYIPLSRKRGRVVDVMEDVLLISIEGQVIRVKKDVAFRLPAPID